MKKLELSVLAAILALVIHGCSTTSYEERRTRDGWSPPSVSTEDDRVEPIRYKATF